MIHAYVEVEKNTKNVVQKIHNVINYNAPKNQDNLIA